MVSGVEVGMEEMGVVSFGADMGKSLDVTMTLYLDGKLEQMSGN